MNVTTLIGRLTGNPELKKTQSGTSTTRFTVAVDRRVKQGEEKQADFITVVAWSQRAEMICKYFSKGQKIGITGSIRTGSYTDKNGNKRYTFEVWADQVDFCESRNAQSTPSQQSAQNQQYSGQRQQDTQHTQQSTQQAAYNDSDEYVEIADDDLPF